MRIATGTTILRAFEKARRMAEHTEEATETQEPAGVLVRGRPGSQTLYEVFVRIVRRAEGGTIP